MIKPDSASANRSCPFQTPRRLLWAGLALICLWTSTGFAAPLCVLHGEVIDTLGAVIPRATVTVTSGGKQIGGIASDLSGRFLLKLSDTAYSSVIVRATSVGFEPGEVSLLFMRDTQFVRIVCRPKIVETQKVEVTAQRPAPTHAIRLERQAVAENAMRALVPSDPLSAVRYPQLAHFGLNFASQLRIDGSIPRYYLNGMSIGADPTHFGAFAFIPTPAVEQLTFSPQGTGASFASPTAIELNTAKRFESASRGEISASIIDITGSYLHSSPKFFAGGTVRRSLIDQLANKLNFGSSRHEIPAPKLTDFTLGLGLKPSDKFQIFSDLYHIEDNLRYTLGVRTGTEGRVITDQKGFEDHAAVRTVFESGRWTSSLGLGLRTGHRYFNLFPDLEANTPLRVAFEEKYQYYQATADLGYRRGLFEFRTGTQYEAISSLDLHLSQYLWNLLSPFAHSDNLNLFQSSIDRFYRSFNGAIFGYNNGLHLSGTLRSGRLELESGVRLETFSYLAHKNRLASRQAAKISIGPRNSVNLFYGTFFESPVTTAMESYQVPVRMYVSGLDPVETRLATASLNLGALTLEVFDKEIIKQPVLTPDYDHYFFQDTAYYPPNPPFVYRDFDPRFLRPHSTGRSTFEGISLTLDCPKLFGSRFDFYGSYSFSRARTTIEGVMIPHDLDAPHRLDIQTGYFLGKHLRCAAELSIHTGYPYTPAHLVPDYDLYNPPDREAYLRDLRLQNSERFSANISLNLHCSYRIGRLSIFASVINATNHANEMIRSSDEFVYDSGLIPNLGFSYEF